MDPNSNANYAFCPVRTAAILTTGVVNGTVLGTGGSGNVDNLFYGNQLIILADFTIGSLTNVIITVEFSPDNTNWYAETYEDVTAATGVTATRIRSRVIAATGKVRYQPITIMDRYIRISAQGTGTVTSSSLKIDALVGKI